MAKPKFKAGIGESSPKIFEDTVVNNLESMVRFSFTTCDTKKYCIRLLEDQEITNFYTTLAKFEKMTWKEVHKLPREIGFSIEKKEQENHKMLSGKYKLFSTFLHFRVSGPSKLFRVFAARQDDLVYLLILDRKGEINH